MSEYTEHFITTFLGGKFHYLNPLPEEIDIVTIAHALSLTCRFGGHVREFYSVAQHSIHVAELVPPELKLSALLHDAHEAYLHDVPRPIKQDMKGYKEIADNIQRAIDKKFNLVTSPEIRRADNIMLITEARDLLVNTDGWAGLGVEPIKDTIYPWTPSDAEMSFMGYFKLFTG